MTVACIQEINTFDYFVYPPIIQIIKELLIIAWLVKFVLLINLQYLIVLGYKNVIIVMA